MPKNDEEKDLTRRGNSGNAPLASTASAAMSQSFTPGPWHVDDGGDPIRIRSERYCVALATGGLDETSEPGPTTVANARLISAAPDLLIALKQIHAWLLDDVNEPVDQWAHPLFRKSYKLATAAIQKAEGR